MACSVTWDKINLDLHMYETKIEESEKVGSRQGLNPGHP